MKTLLTALLLALPALAQSGTIHLPATTTNSERVLDIPPPGPGMTRLEVGVAATFEQGCNVWSTYASPVPVAARFGCAWEITSGGAVLARGATRQRLDMLCDFGTTEAFGVSTVGGAAEFAIPPQPLSLRLLARTHVAAALPFDQGQLVHQTISRAGAVVEWSYLP